MPILYDKKSGKSFNVPHAVDVKDWIASGEYSLEAPKGVKPIKKAQPTKPNLLDRD